MSYRIGIDTGGTHTDVVLLDEETGAIATTKVPTTPHDLTVGIMHGIEKILRMARSDTSRLARFVYGTTLVTNMIVQGDETKVGLVTTRGFRDVLEIGKAARRWNIYDIYADKPRALIPRQLRLTVAERVNARGEVVEELDEADVQRAADELGRQGVRAVAVCLLHSYINPKHELRVGEILRERLPGAHISLSCQVMPEFREYERCSTTVINALVTPPMVEHLDHLDDQLRRAGVRAHRYLMQSNGGVATFAAAKERPVNALHSGPIAGVVGAVLIARLAGFKDVITMDMGGTSCDVSLVENYEPRMAADSTVAGHAVKLPTIDLHTIGAGGGSIAWIDAGGALKVGPRSAGALPGPACYGLGGSEPTVTDANLVTGRVGADSFLGGEMHLDEYLARSCLQERVARPLGIDLLRAAEGILEIANSNMIKAIKLVSVARGYDPRDFALVAFGGAGPMHATRIAEELGCRTVIVPFAPGVTAALGLLASSLRRDYVVSRIGRLDQLDHHKVADYYNEMAQQAREHMLGEGVDASRVVITNSADVRYSGQAYELNVPVANGLRTPADLAELARRFNELHRRRFGYSSEKSPVEIVNLRVTAIGVLAMPQVPIHPAARDRDPEDALLGRRGVFLRGRAITTPVYAAARLQPGHVVEGPAIVQDAGSTTVLFPGQVAAVDQYKNLLVQLNSPEETR